jgi:hypothetical protein
MLTKDYYDSTPCGMNNWILTKSNSSGGLYMGLYSKIWRF